MRVQSRLISGRACDRGVRGRASVSESVCRGSYPSWALRRCFCPYPARRSLPFLCWFLRQHVRRHCFLQWWTIAQERKAFRGRVEMRRLAETMHAWRSLLEKRRNEREKTEELRRRECRRLLQSCWKQWRRRWLRYVTFRAQCRGLQETVS